MTRPICLVTGATGALGPSVVAALSRTYEIRTLSRHPPRTDLFSNPITVTIGDVADRATVRQSARGTDVIVHLAALLHIVNPPPSLRAEYERVNVGGTQAVVDAAVAEGTRRVVLLSTIAVYGQQHKILNEDSVPSPQTFYGQTKLAAEHIALGARRADGTPLASVLRSAAVYGPRVKGNYRSLVDALARGRFIPIGPGDNRRTLIFETDLAEAIALSATHPAAAGRIYNVSDGQFHAMHDILAAIAKGLGRRPPRWRVPLTPARLAGRGAAIFAPRVAKALEKYLEEICVEAVGIQRELGFSPQFDLERGWAVTVEQMRRDALSSDPATVGRSV